MRKYFNINIVIVVVAVPLLAWSGFYLKKIKLSKRHKAVYATKIYENLKIEKSKEDKSLFEQMISHVDFYVEQEVLSYEKKNYTIDYVLTDYNRLDSSIINGVIDTASNRGEVPRSKNLMNFTDMGEYLGGSLEKTSPKLQTRDYRYFYKIAKQLIYEINDSSKHADTWQAQRTDTIFTSGFQLVFNYPLTFSVGAKKDTLGFDAIEINYQSSTVEFYTVNNMLKALGIETSYAGIAAVSGRLLVDKKTGRIVRLDEEGSFIGATTTHTNGEKTEWPTTYKYNKQVVLDTLIKKPRKKLWGIF